MFIKHAVRRVSLFCLLVTLFSYALPAMADDDDPPSRVARLAYAQGSVSFQPAGTDDWVTAGVNRPATTGDKLWSDRDGRVELQLDGSLIRLSNNTGFSFLNLSDSVTQIQLTAGTLLVRVRRLDDNETYEIDTPNLAFSVLRPGLYKISVNDAGDSTTIKISSGQGEVTGGGAAYTVHANDYATFSGFDHLSANSENYGNEEDQFDNWAATRDRHSEHSNSARYVSSDVVGYEDLDDHGSWRQTPDNGNVWFPRTSVQGWAPYHYGHWDYIEPWGYTWVDDEPWGFAPFHYGRWVSYEGSWGWVPAPPRSEGVVYVRPVYAPALVAWVGGPHFAIGVGVGGGEYASGESVGWFPLGPREVYVPSYRVSRNYVNNVNVSNTTVNSTVVNNYYNNTVVNNNVNVTNVKYVNQSVPGAVAATTPHAFTGAQPVNKNSVKLDQREVASAPVRAFTPAAVPAKQAVLGTGTAAVKPPAAVQTRAVVAKIAPPPPPPTFEKRQEAIKSNGGKPLSSAQVQQIAPAAAHREAPVKIAPAAKAVAAPVPVANRPGQPQTVQPPSVQPAQAAPTAGNKAVPIPDHPADRPTEHPASLPETPEPVQTNRPPVVNKSPQTAAPETAQPSNPSGNRPTERPANPHDTPEPLQTNRPPSASNPPPTPDRHTDRPPTPSDANSNASKTVTPNSRPSTNPPNDRPAERPGNPNITSQPPQPNRTAPPPAVHPNEIPAPPRPVVQSSANAELDRKHQQEQDQLHTNQQQDRQRVQQQQEQEHAKLAQQQADAAKKQQVEQQHQAQTQQLQEKHAQEQKQLQDKQQQERQNPPKPQKKEDRPPADKP
jgi:FecR protein